MTPTTTPTAENTPAAPAPERVQLDQIMHLPADERKPMLEIVQARQRFAYWNGIATVLVRSGQFDDLKGMNHEQAVATAMCKIVLGHEWGLSPADAVRYVYFVNGKPAVENEIIANRLQAAGYDWDVEWMEVAEPYKGQTVQRCIGCRLWLKKWNAEERRYLPVLDRNKQEVSVAYTEADAARARYYDKGTKKPLLEKATYQENPRDMYYWKTIARVKKFHAPHVLGGVVSRDEALELLPTSGPMMPDMLPPGLEPPDEPAPELPPRKPFLEERILNQLEKETEPTPSS